MPPHEAIGSLVPADKSLPSHGNEHQNPDDDLPLLTANLPEALPHAGNHHASAQPPPPTETEQPPSDRSSR